MNAVSELLLDGIVRTTLCTTLAALATLLLLSPLGISSIRIHRAAWVLVIFQGWILLPLTLTVSVSHELPTEQLSVVSSTSSVPIRTIQSQMIPHIDEPSRWRENEIHAVFAVWLLGMLTVLGFYLKRYYSLVVHAPLGSASESDEWNEEWSESVETISASSNVHFRVTNSVGPLLCYVPFVYLVLVPKILWATLCRVERLAILQHELAHLKHGDLWKNLLIRIFALPQWFNPFVWLAVRRFEETGEWACDENVIASTGIASSSYANTLIRVADFTANTPCGAVAASGGLLRRRVTRLLSSPNKEVSKMKNLALPILLLAITTGQGIRIESVYAEELEKPTAVENKTDVVALWNKETYIVEPPDVLLLEGLKLVPKSPHKFEIFDTLLVRVKGAYADQPIDDAYSIDDTGSINLGPTYGRVKVAGLTAEEAQDEIRGELAQILTYVDVSVSLHQAPDVQQVTGKHLVGPDGRVNLGSYGSVYVVGMTIEEVRAAVEKLLSAKLEEPEVVVDVHSYNSKVYYIVTQEKGCTHGVTRMSMTGRETVLDAVASLGGISQDSSPKLWIARPAPNGIGSEQVLPVNWEDITRGLSATNYQLMPGDRLFIETKNLPIEKNSTRSAVMPPTEIQLNPYSASGMPTEQIHNDTVVKLTFHIIDDFKRNLSAIEGLELRGKGISVICDTSSTLGLIRVLERNRLARVIAAPEVTTELGRPASIAIESSQQPSTKSRLGHLEIEVTTSGRSEGELLATKVSVNIDGNALELEMEPKMQLGQSCILRLSDDHDRYNETHDIYLVLSLQE